MGRDFQTDILQAATEVYSVYGYQKTTMNGFARQTGVARQTLYNRFRTKLLCMMPQSSTLPKGRLPTLWRRQVDNDIGRKTRSVSQKLRAARLYETVQQEIDQRFKALFVSFLRPHGADVKSAGLKLNETADMMYSLLLNAKYAARDINHLERLHKKFIRFIINQFKE